MSIGLRLRSLAAPVKVVSPSAVVYGIVEMVLVNTCIDMNRRTASSSVIVTGPALRSNTAPG